jgi:hypothetical protein
MVQAFFIPALQENPSPLLQTAFLKLLAKPPRFTHNVQVLINNTVLEHWVGQGGPMNWLVQ